MTSRRKLSIWGFTGSAGVRLLAVGVYAALAAIAIVAVESRSVMATRTEQTPLKKPISQEAHLAVRSTYEVVDWQVGIGGVKIVPSESDAGMWRGTLSVPDAQGEVLIEAHGGDFFADHDEALQVELSIGERKITRLFWGKGDIVAALRWDEGDGEP